MVVWGVVLGAWGSGGGFQEAPESSFDFGIRFPPPHDSAELGPCEVRKFDS